MKISSGAKVFLLAIIVSIIFAASAQSPCISSLLISISGSGLTSLENFEISIDNTYFGKTGAGGTFRIPLDSNWIAGTYLIEAFKQDESGCYSKRMEQEINPCNRTVRGGQKKIEIEVKKVQCGR
jgi:hypothetical protein